VPHNLRLVFLWIVFLPIYTACSVNPTQLVTATQIHKAPTETVTPSQQPTVTQVTGSWQELDLRYAQVLDVTFEILESFRIRFDVTLIHDDDGESPQFADWWQVEDRSGNILGKRILTHSHGNLPFTRSATIEIPSHVESVIVRGHDMLHGFGGQVIQLNLMTGEKSILSSHP
jgi:hypothetical protein